MGNTTGNKSLLQGGDRISILLCKVFAKYAQAEARDDNGNLEHIKKLAKNGEGPFKGLKELYYQSCQAKQDALTKEEFDQMMEAVCNSSQDWFPSFIVGSNMSEQKKMEIIAHFEENFAAIDKTFRENIDETFAVIDDDQSGTLTWEQFSANFFDIILREVQAAQAKTMVQLLKNQERQEQEEQNQRKSELREIFKRLATHALEGKDAAEAKADPSKVRAKLILGEMLRQLMTDLENDVELKRIFKSMFEYLESRVDSKLFITEAMLLEQLSESWIEFNKMSERLVCFPRNSYAEVYSRKHCRWKLAIVKRFFILEDCQIWARLYIPSSSETKSVNLMDTNVLQTIQWSRGRKVEVKEGNNFYPGVVILAKDTKEGERKKSCRSKGGRWVGMEYLDPNMKVKRVKVDTRYCPKLFRPLQNESGIRFGYTVSLVNVFYDAGIDSFRYLLEVRGPGTKWWVAKNFTLMRTFWSSIRKSVDYEGIQFPKSKLIGCKDRKFVKERKEELETFWRRLTRLLHLIDDSTLQRVAQFLEIPFVSQRMYKKALKKKTYVRLLRVENLPLITDEQGKAKMNNTYVHMKLSDDPKTTEDVEEWISKADSTNPAWNATRPLVTTGENLVIELWQDFAGKQPDFKFAKLIMNVKHLTHGQKSAITIPVSTKVKPNPNGKCRVILQLVDEPPKEKWVFLIRHGQSKWNAAKREFDLYTAFGIIDHGLTKKGAEQADELNKKMDEIKWKIRPEPMYQAFFGAKKVYSSPLSRAAESAVIGLRNHPHVKAHGIQLLADAREKRTMMGMDCTGQFRGSKIISHIQSEFKEIYGEVPEDVKNVKVDPNDALHRWWNEKGESSSGFAQRVDQAMKTIMFDQADSIIVVCHSMVIRHIFRRYISPEFSRKDEVTAHDLAYEKLQNMGVTAMRIDRTKFECIQSAALMFDSKVLRSKKNERRPSIVQASGDSKSDLHDYCEDTKLDTDSKANFEALFSPQHHNSDTESLKIKREQAEKVVAGKIAFVHQRTRSDLGLGSNSLSHGKKALTPGRQNTIGSSPTNRAPSTRTPENRRRSPENRRKSRIKIQMKAKHFGSWPIDESRPTAEGGAKAENETNQAPRDAASPPASDHEKKV